MWPNADPTPLPHSGIFKTCPTWQLTSQSHDCLEPTKRPPGKEKINVSSRYIVSAGQKIIVKKLLSLKTALGYYFLDFRHRQKKEQGMSGYESGKGWCPPTSDSWSALSKAKVINVYKLPKALFHFMGAQKEERPVETRTGRQLFKWHSGSPAIAFLSWPPNTHNRKLSLKNSPGAMIPPKKSHRWWNSSPLRLFLLYRIIVNWMFQDEDFHSLKTDL